MKLTIHRGSDVIGGTCVELKTDKTRIIVDFGMPLVDARKESFDSKTLIGKSIEDLKKREILPDIKGFYKGEEKAVDAILISHSHMDHYGLLGYVHPDIPIYMSEGAKRLIEISEIFIPHKMGKINSQVIVKQKKTAIGDFSVTPSLVDHSAFDALAFLIEANGRKAFYSGDFRGHGRKAGLFQRMLANPPKNIDCLLMEGSMLGRGEQLCKDEDIVEQEIAKILRGKENIAFLFFSSQNIDRLVSAYRACLQTNSIFVIDIYTAFILHRLSDLSKIPRYDWDNIRVRYFFNHAESLAKAGYKDLLNTFKKRKIRSDEIASKREKILMVLRDNSVFKGEVKRIGEINGAKIIYSMWEGYLKPKFEEYCLENGIEIKQIHTSGHATVKDLQAFANALAPRMLVPIHTFGVKEYPKLFKNVKVLEDGEALEI